MKRMLLLAALCALAIAMVPRQRRAVEEQVTSSTLKPICQWPTPCGWDLYNEHPERVYSTKDNSDYCECAINMVCVVDEDDTNGKSLIKRCKVES